MSVKSKICFSDPFTEKASSEWVISLQLTIYFGVIHGFVFRAFDSQLNTVARQEHFPRLWMLRRTRSTAVTWMQQLQLFAYHMYDFFKRCGVMTRMENYGSVYESDLQYAETRSYMRCWAVFGWSPQTGLNYEQVSQWEDKDWLPPLVKLFSHVLF